MEPAQVADNALAKCAGPQAIVVGKNAWKCKSEKHYIGAALVNAVERCVSNMSSFLGRAAIDAGLSFQEPFA